MRCKDLHVLKILLPLFALASIPAEAVNWQVHRDSSGMPRCLQDLDNWQNGIYFHWDNSKQYKRELFAIPIQQFPANNYPVHCSRWSRFSGTAVNGSNLYLNEKTKFSPEQNLRDVPQAIREEIEQARMGSNSPWSTASFSYYVQKAIAEGYSAELNKEISDKHGLFFSTDIFRSWLRSKEKTFI
jgi:hypothetical protein